MTFQEIKKFAEIKGYELGVSYPKSSSKWGTPKSWDSNQSYEVMIGFTKKTKSYWWTAAVYSTEELNRVEVDMDFRFDHSYSSNTGKVLRSLNEKWDLENKIKELSQIVAEL